MSGANPMSLGNLTLFTGNSNPRLASDIAGYLNLPLGKISVDRFSDGEVMVEIAENIRGREVFVIQSLCTPVNDNLMELLVIADAARRASATGITAVIPYMGYARQDRRPRSARVPITAKVVANMIGAVGIDRVLTVDLHADQIQGFFDMPLDNVYASPVLLGDIWKHKYPNQIVVSPDVGGVVRARALAKRLDDTELAIIDKRRPHPNESEVMNIIGDVDGRTCVIIDDLVDTAGTLCNAAGALKDFGAERVVAYCTHPVLSGSAVRNIGSSVLDELVVTDTIPLREDAATSDRIRQLSVAAMLAESIRRVTEGESLSSMFVD
jgi:ribose-phosphate pyrophosphokinase